MNSQINHTFHDHILLQNCHTAVFVTPGFEPQNSVSPSLPKIVSTTLSPHDNGVMQIARVLAYCPQVPTVYIHANGEPGQLILGNVHLTVDTIDQYAWDIQSWFGAIPSFVQPSLVLNGCKVGDGEKGNALIHRLRYLTGSHITCQQSSAQRHLQLV